MLNPELVSQMVLLGKDDVTAITIAEYISGQITTTDFAKKEMTKQIMSEYDLLDSKASDTLNVVLKCVEKIKPDFVLKPILSDEIHDLGIEHIHHLLDYHRETTIMFNEYPDLRRIGVLIARLLTWLVELDVRGLRRKYHTHEVCRLYFECGMGAYEVFELEIANGDAQLLAHNLLQIITSQITSSVDDSQNFITSTSEFGEGLKMAYRDYDSDQGDGYVPTHLLAFVTSYLDPNFLSDRIRQLEYYPLMATEESDSDIVFYPFIL